MLKPLKKLLIVAIFTTLIAAVWSPRAQAYYYYPYWGGYGSYGYYNVNFALRRWFGTDYGLRTFYGYPGFYGFYGFYGSPYPNVAPAAANPYKRTQDSQIAVQLMAQKYENWRQTRQSIRIIETKDEPKSKSNDKPIEINIPNENAPKETLILQNGDNQ